jgi:Subtilisin inhibitor-like
MGEFMTTTSASARASGLGRPARLVAVAGLLAATVLGLYASPSTAQAGPEPSPQRPLADLDLSITPAGAVAKGTVTTVKLTCTPDGGTHPTPKEACTSLRNVGGNFLRLPDVPNVRCPTIYDPVVASATGYWQSSPSGPIRFVRYSETFSNRCFAAVGTDFVFRF